MDRLYSCSHDLRECVSCEVVRKETERLEAETVAAWRLKRAARSAPAPKPKAGWEPPAADFDKVWQMATTPRRRP